MPQEKMMVTLPDGKKVRVGVKEFIKLNKALEEQKPPKEVLKAALNVVLSSDDMIKSIVKETKENGNESKKD